jgi:hypothetical protein
MAYRSFTRKISMLNTLAILFASFGFKVNDIAAKIANNRNHSE